VLDEGTYRSRLGAKAVRRRVISSTANTLYHQRDTPNVKASTSAPFEAASTKRSERLDQPAAPINGWQLYGIVSGTLKLDFIKYDWSQFLGKRWRRHAVPRRWRRVVSKTVLAIKTSAPME